MHDSEIDLIERAYELWAAGDFEGLLALVSEDVVWVPPSYALEPGPFRGKDAVRRGIDAYFEVFEHFQPHPERIIPAPQRGVFLVLVRTETRGRGSGVETTMDVAHLITVEDGRFTRVEIIPDRPAAFARAGIDPAEGGSGAT